MSIFDGAPVYPLVLHEEGDWTPVPVMYFTRDFILRVIERTTREDHPDFGWRYRMAGGALGGRPTLVYDDPTDDPLLPPRKPKGHRVWRLYPKSWARFEHDDDVDMVIRGVWPD